MIFKLKTFEFAVGFKKLFGSLTFVAFFFASTKDKDKQKKKSYSLVVEQKEVLKYVLKSRNSALFKKERNFTSVHAT